MRIKGRQYIPIIPIKQAPSLWQRARSAASTVVTTVRSAAARVVAFVARKATGARAALSRIARTAMIRRPWVLTRDGAVHATQMVSSWTKSTWHRVVRPFMHVRVAVLGIGAVVIGLVVAPVATLVTLAGCGAALIGLSRLIQRLESSDRSAARVALRVIEVAAQVLRVVAYVAAGVAVIAISAVSAAFAVTEVLELVLRYLDVPLAVSIATLAFFVLTASWGLVFMEMAWLALIHEGKVPVRVTRSRSGDRQAIPLIRIDAERVWNGDETVGIAVPMATEEDMQETTCGKCFDERLALLHEGKVPSMVDRDEVLARTAKCMGCDLDDGSSRYRVGDMSSLCGECFQCLVDDELISAADRGEVDASDVVTAIRAGIPVPAYVVIATGARLRSTRIDLDREAITCRAEARALSEQDPSRIHWTETGWWFDGRGGRRARRWHGFVSGRVAASVAYRHEKDVRGFYFTVEGDSRTSRCFKTLAGAQDAAADEVSDRRQAEPRDGSRVGTLLAGAVS